MPHSRDLLLPSSKDRIESDPTWASAKLQIPTIEYDIYTIGFVDPRSTSR